MPRGWEADALGLSAAHRASQGAGVTVAVLDSGVAADHPGLKGKVTTGPDFFADGLDPASPRWGKHGTAMASDVLEVAPQAKILSVRVIDDSEEGEDQRGEGLEPIADGIRYAVDHGADVISLSLGSDDFTSYSNYDAEAVGYAVSHGVTVVAGAGNSGDDSSNGAFPAGYASTIAVAATQRDAGRAEFSTVRTHNLVAAPGVGIVSAMKEGGYRAVNSTSPATALAAGVVALMRSHNPKLTPGQIRTILTRTAHHPPGGRDAQVGYGQIDAATAVKAAASPPADRAGTVEYQGKKHFADPTGTSKSTTQPLEQGVWLTGLGVAGVGAGDADRRSGPGHGTARRRAGATAGAGPTGMAPPPRHFPT
ncbi:S8 family peptidase [Streptomyces flavidovirens]